MASTLYVDNIRNNSSSVTLTPQLLQRRTLQRAQLRTQWGAYNPQNEWRALPGSYITIIPKASNSIIDYMFDISIGWRGGSSQSITHWIFRVNNDEYHRHGQSQDHLEGGHNLKWQVSSYGKGVPMTMGYWVRQYSDANHSAHFNASHYWNGTGDTRVRPVLVRAEEFYTSPL
jgi:hypothetical protein